MHKIKKIKKNPGNLMVKENEGERERGRREIDRNEGMVRSLVTFIEKKVNVASSDCNQMVVCNRKHFSLR